ncbi:hypothetical protein PC9H_008845 [Pleurotus ostreatus]|uniref:Mug135-like C-terminal domain-containing protein n=2 Tax=Pleurotus TaxID=5320 RepID=A0A8H6ZTY4_PLEOS|nr:uncharacterized protein PC9H_008845 [Pleurotus ostreatus]KAF7426476.1 hypothetical protein PC9H_008845 [Pleurotus ostreatus]KAG9221955.1 hypothetical protein CCMSSC00406_0009163 [Pleurotus cornucopiae]
MPAIAVPALSPGLRKIVTRPNQPSNPPTIDDAAVSCIIAFQAIDARLHTNQPVTNEDIVCTAQYQAQVMAGVEEGQPPWFAAAMTPTTAAQTQMDARIDSLVGETRTGRRTAALLWNRTHGVASDARLEVVPFADGTDPTREPHNLQAITSAGMISTLAYEDKVAYFTNYYCGEEVPAAAQLNSHIIQVVGVKRNVS